MSTQNRFLAGPEEFFWLTMLTVVVLNAANGLYQNSIYGFVSDFPAQFINAIVIGNNACGILVSVIAILGIFCKFPKITKSVNWPF